MWSLEASSSSSSSSLSWWGSQTVTGTVTGAGAGGGEEEKLRVEKRLTGKLWIYKAAMEVTHQELCQVFLQHQLLPGKHQSPLLYSLDTN